MLTHTLETLKSGITAGDHIGAQLSVVRGGETMANVAVGNARLGLPLASESLCVWMSSGKPMTAVAVLQLVEQNKLTLDTPVVEVIPEFAEHGKDHITVRHLLTHTAGKRRVDTGFPGASWVEMVQRVCASKLRQDWVPEERGAYDASASWIILAELIQRASGQRYPTYMREHLFLPLGMTDCWLGMPSRAYHQRSRDIAVMHRTTGDAPEPLDWHTLPALATPMPGRNLVGPAHQITRFYQMLLGGGALDGTTLVTADTVAQLTARQRQDVHDETFHHVMDFGLGVLINLEDAQLRATMPYGFGPHASPTAFGHGGQGSSVAFADPEHGLAVALVWNGVLDEQRHQPRLRDTLAALYRDLGLA